MMTMRIAAVLAMAAVSLPASAQARSVTVVFDDSGSMRNGLRWQYANYALQSLTALLSSADRLQLVRMSSPSKLETLSLGDRQAATVAVRRIPGPESLTGTPYQALRTAMAAIGDANSGESWLVVLSDGELENVPTTSLDLEITEFVRRTGSRVIFLLIGESEAAARGLAAQPGVSQWADLAQANVYLADGRLGIIEQVARIAADISGRELGDGPQLTVVGDSLRITSEFPLRRVLLMEQDSASAGRLAAVRSAMDASQTSLRASRVDITKPASQGGITLFGRVHEVTAATRGGLLRSGTTLIVVDAAVSATRTRVLPEVAAELVWVLRDSTGRELPVIGNLVQGCIGRPVTVEATLIGADRDTLLSFVRTPNRLTFVTKYGTATLPMERDSRAALYATAFTPQDSGTQSLSVTATYPGYLNTRSRQLTVATTDCDPVRLIALTQDEPWQAYVTQLDAPQPVRWWYRKIATLLGGAEYVEPMQPATVRLEANGSRLAASEVARWKVEASTMPGLVAVATQDTLGIVLRPKARWGIPAVTPTGQFAVALRAQSPRPREGSVAGEAQLLVRPVPWYLSWLPLLLAVLLLLFGAWYIVGVIRKPRFARSSGIKYTSIRATRDAWKPLRPRSAAQGLRRWLVPYRAERRTLEGLEFVATRRASAVLVAKKEFAGNDQLQAFKDDLEIHLPATHAVSLENNQELRMKRGKSVESFRYSDSDEPRN